VKKTFAGFMRNLGGDLKDVAIGLTAPFHSYPEFEKGISDMIYNEEGEYSLDGAKDMGGAFVDRAREIITSPVDSLYERPLSTGMDIATVALPVRGASKMMPDGSTAQKITERAANVIQNADPFAAATTAGAAINAAATNPQKLTESVIKPSNGRTSRESDQGYRQQVMNSALDRDITPNGSGMRRLDDQISSTGAKIDELLENSSVVIEMKPLVEGFEGWAKSQISQTNNNWASIRTKVEEKSAQIKSQYGTTPEGDSIVGINGEGLRKMRQSADGDVNHNRVSQQNDSAKVEVDKLYAEYLREQLSSKVDGIDSLNSEMSTLLRIDDMYGPAYNRLSQNNPIGLGTVAAMGTGGPAVGYGIQAGDPLIAAGGAAAMVAPFINNPTVRGARAGSAHRSRRAGGSGAGVPGPLAGLLGAAARDRNDIPFYLRQSGSALEGLFSEAVDEESR
jgi:hypothetical protein